MKRETCMFRLHPSALPALEAGFAAARAEISRHAARLGADNAAAFTVAGYLYLYAEFADGSANGLSDLIRPWESLLTRNADYVARPGEMRLMYHDIGIVRADKSLIRRRVFATHLKPGCADEYRARHLKLINARGDRISEGPESNFTIWCARDEFIFGYCELVKSFDHEMTEEEKASTIAWETRQLEIMDWLTDDVDWITGERHEKMGTLYLQKA